MIARALTVIVVLIVADDARAQPVTPLARQFSDQGRAFHDLGDYDQAIVAYKQAYVLAPSPGILFNMAQAYRLAGDCANAAMLYRRFLQKSVDPAASRIARQQLAAVEPCADRAESAAVGPAALPRPDRAAVTASSDGGRHHTGLYIAGAGALVVGVGAYFALDARSASDQVSAAYARGASWADVAPLDERGRRSSDLATGFLIAGGATVVAGVVLYAIERREPDPRAPMVFAAPATRGATVGVSWTF